MAKKRQYNPSINDAIADALRSRSISLERLAQGWSKNIIEKNLRGLYADLLGKKIVRDQMQLLKLGLSGDLAVLPERRFSEYLSIVKNTIDLNFGKIGLEIDDNLVSLASLEGAWVAKTLDKNLGVKMFASGLTDKSQIKALQDLTKTLRVAGAPMKTWWLRQAESFKNRYIDTLQLGWAQGLNNSVLLESMLSPTMYKNGTLADPVLDIMKGTLRGAKALIRTSVQTLANDARKIVYKENSDLIKGYVWLSTLDDRTSIECAGRDGLMWDLDGNPIGHDKVLIWPPAHWNCRSVVTPVLKTFKELGIDAEEIPESTRASIDGQVPRKETFSSWLKDREETRPGFAEKVFGKERSDLWKKGKLTIRQMTDQTGNILSLEELS